MSQHRIHHDLHRVGKQLIDPGNGGTIHVREDLQVLEIVTTTAETRTLARPVKQGIRFTLRLLTDGGTLTVTGTGGLNQTGNTTATFADASDVLVLISVRATAPTATAAATYRWDILANAGVTLS